MSTAPAPHVHTAACLAGNELNELCCLHLAGQQLQASERWVVPTTTGDVNTFTYSAEDALALVRTDGKEPTGAPPRLDPQPDPYLS